MIQRCAILHLPQARQQPRNPCSAAATVGRSPMARKSRRSLPTPCAPQRRGPRPVCTSFTRAGTSNAAGVIGPTPMANPNTAPPRNANAHMRVMVCKSGLHISTVEIGGVVKGGSIKKYGARHG
jgi:hypothetical protein